MTDAKKSALIKLYDLEGDIRVVRQMTITEILNLNTIIEDLREELRNAEAERDDATDDAEALRDENTALSEAYNQRSVSNIHLMAERDKAKDERDAALVKAGNFLNQVNRQATTIQGLSDDVASADKERDDMQRQHDYLRDRFDVTNKELKATKAVNKDLAAAFIGDAGEPCIKCAGCAQLRKDLREANVALEAATIESNRYEDEALGYAKRAGDLDTERMKNERELAVLRRNHEDSNARVETLRTKYNGLIVERNELRAKLKARKSDVFDTVIERMRRDGLISRVSAEPGEMMEVEFSNAETKKLFDQMKSEVSGLRKSRESCREILLEVRGERGAALMKAAVLQAQVCEQAKTIGDLQAKHEDIARIALEGKDA